MVLLTMWLLLRIIVDTDLFCIVLNSITREVRPLPDDSPPIPADKTKDQDICSRHSNI